jgi:hypothetical protein
LVRWRARGDVGLKAVFSLAPLALVAGPAFGMGGERGLINLSFYARPPP